jgi:hypothetical protein
MAVVLGVACGRQRWRGRRAAHAWRRRVHIGGCRLVRISFCSFAMYSRLVAVDAGHGALPVYCASRSSVRRGESVRCSPSAELHSAWPPSLASLMA